MDATQQFTVEQGITVPKTFVIAGASKVKIIKEKYWIFLIVINSVDGQVSDSFSEIAFFKEFISNIQLG